MIILFYNKVLCLAFSFQFCLLGFYHLVSRLLRKSTSALFFSCVFCSLWICLSMQLHFFFGLFPSLALNHRVWWYPAIQPWQRTFPDTFSGMDAHKFSSVINLHKESRKSMSSCPCLPLMGTGSCLSLIMAETGAKLSQESCWIGHMGD